MIKSSEIDKLAAGLVVCQGLVQNAKKEATNPHFNRKYADLAGVMEAAREAMANAGLALTFNLSTDEKSVILEPLLVHTSGQFIMYDPFKVPLAQVSAQGQGSAITYGRRYLFQSIIGLAAEEDDDGHSISQPQPTRANQRPAAKAPEQKAPEKSPEPTKDPDFEAARQACLDAMNKHPKLVTDPTGWTPLERDTLNIKATYTEAITTHNTEALQALKLKIETYAQHRGGDKQDEALAALGACDNTMNAVADVAENLAKSPPPCLDQPAEPGQPEIF